MTGQYDLKFETIFEAMSNKIVYYILNNEIRRQSGRIGKMTSGKTVAQVSHASVRMFQSGVSTTEWQENSLASKIFNGSPAVIDKIISCAKTRRINYVTGMYAIIHIEMSFLH